jgi:hypothetical protein
MRDPIVPLLLFYCKKNAISWNILGGVRYLMPAERERERESDRGLSDRDRPSSSLVRAPRLFSADLFIRNAAASTDSFSCVTGAELDFY